MKAILNRMILKKDFLEGEQKINKVNTRIIKIPKKIMFLNPPVYKINTDLRQKKIICVTTVLLIKI
jgi:hypothetical protein